MDAGGKRAITKSRIITFYGSADADEETSSPLRNKRREYSEISVQAAQSTFQVYEWLQHMAKGPMTTNAVLAYISSWDHSKAE